MSDLPGVDVASYQGLPGQWSAAAGRIAWAAVKITELQPPSPANPTGKYVNPDAAADWAWLKEHGKGRIGYLFGHPSTSPTVTVEFFLAELAKLGLEDVDAVAIDIEETDGQSPAQVDVWVSQVANGLHDKLGRQPLIYTFLYFAEAGNCASQGDRPLWMSDPSSKAGRPRVPAPWKRAAIHQYATTGQIDRDVALFPNLAAMQAALGKPRPVVWVDYVTTGRESLIRIARRFGTEASTILRKTVEHVGVYRPELAHYLNAGNLTARMPKGIVLRVPSTTAAARPSRVRHAAVRAAGGVKTTATAARAVVRSEPVMTSAVTLAAVAPAAVPALRHAGLHLTATEASAALTILTALASAYAAIRTRPVRVPVLTGAAATIATAVAAFGLHIPASWIGAETPLVALLAGLLLRVHVSPKSAARPVAPKPSSKSVGQYEVHITAQSDQFHAALDEIVAHAESAAERIKAAVPGVATDVTVQPVAPAPAPAAATPPAPAAAPPPATTAPLAATP